MSLIPFLIIALIAVFWLIYAKFIYKKEKKLLYFIEHLLTSTVICVFSIQPSIINSLISLISCQEIGDKSYIKSYLLEECYTERHQNWMLGLFLPAFLLYGLLMPLMALIYMFINKEHLYESNHIKKVGFLSNGFSYNKFYWEFLFFYRKIFLIFIIEYISWNSSSKALLMILILWISLWYQAKDNPYLTSDLNSIDFKATFVSFVTIFAGLLSFQTDRAGVQIIVIIVVFFFNLLFLYYWLRRILIIKLPLYMDLKYLKCLVPFFKKMLPEYNNLKAQALKVDLLHCMSASFKKTSETPSSGAVALDHKNQRKTVFSHFKDALSKLIANAADENQRNSRFLTSNPDEFIGFEKMKNKNRSSMSMNAFSNNLSIIESTASKNNDISIKLHPVLIEEPKTPISPVEVDIELTPYKNIKDNYLKPKSSRNFEDDSQFQLPISSERKEGDVQEDVYLTKKRKNLFDKQIVDDFDNATLKEMLILKINEIDYLYDEISVLKKEVDELRESNQRIERSLTSIKKHHPIANKMSSIKGFETRKNNIYFQEDKPQIHTFTSPPSDVTKKPHFVKYELDKQQIYKDWVRNKSVLSFLVSFLSFRIKREIMRNKINSNIIKLNCQIKNEITQNIDGLSIKLTTSKSK